jgi:hypothetical protein
VLDFYEDTEDLYKEEGRNKFMNTRLRKIILAILFLFPVCAYSTDKTFTSSGTIIDGNVFVNVYVENDGTIVDMFGGQVENLQTSYISTFNLHGGQIIHSIDIGPLGSIDILNGSVDIGEFILEEKSYTLIRGGQISAGQIKAYYDCVIDIKGGVLQLDSFGMIGFDELPIINIYGYDFNYADNIISGYLIDNNPFSIGGISESEYLRFNLIPEPMSLLTFGIGLLTIKSQKKKRG